MKKFILTILLFTTGLQTFAFEDYIIISDYPVKSVFSEDNNVVSLSPIYDINNSKTNIILKSKNTGKTSVMIETTYGEAYLDVEVKNNETILPELEGLTYFKIDTPEKPEGQ